MKVSFGQIYIEPGVSFPWSWKFQSYLSSAITETISPSEYFAGKYGSDWSLHFWISAKRNLASNEICGPSVFRKAKDVEFTVFIPFDKVPSGAAFAKPAAEFLLAGVREVLERLSIDTTRLQREAASIVMHVCTSPEMFDPED